MSYGSGTLASPSGEKLAKGIGGHPGASTSRANGKQHTLPERAYHKKIPMETIRDHWRDPKVNIMPGGMRQTRLPTRLWGTSMGTSYGGLHRQDVVPDFWSTGEYWNVDSNIRTWGEHELRRNGAAMAHDIHRHDQKGRITLLPQPVVGRLSRENKPRVTTSGFLSPDSSFLETWGFDLGLRDRQAAPATLWKPVGKAEQFRSVRSHNWDKKRMAESQRSMRLTASCPGETMLSTAVRMQPEHIGGEAGELAVPDDSDTEKHGRTHGSRSCHYWDSYDHACKREAAKMAIGAHSPAHTSHPEEYPFKLGELNPAAVYSLKFKKFGHDGLRKHASEGQQSEKTLRP